MSRQKFPGTRSTLSAALSVALLLTLSSAALPRKPTLNRPPRTLRTARPPRPWTTSTPLTTFYLKAFQKDPKDGRYKTSYERLKFSAAALHTKRGEKLRDQGDFVGAMTEFMHALEIDPFV